MATQTQIRRDTAADLASATPVEGELVYDQTNDRLGVGNGSDTADTEALFCLMTGALLGMGPIAATAGGSADALTVTLDPAPTAYAAFQTVLVKAASNNTGAATLNVNGLGAKSIKKNAGADDVDADDIVDGGIYLFIYDGTNFQVTGGVAGGGGGAVFDESASPTGVSSYTFSSIPAGVNRIVVSIADLSGTGSSQLTTRLGDSGGVESTGYDSTYVVGGTEGNTTTEFRHWGSGGNSSSELSGVIVYERVSGNAWAVSAQIAHSNATEWYGTAGSKTLSEELDRVQVIFSSNFDAGSIRCRAFE